jgi:hypothetical protein
MNSDFSATRQRAKIMTQVCLLSVRQSAQSGKMLLVIATCFAINAPEVHRFLVLTSKPGLLADTAVQKTQTAQIGGTDEV